jgi:ATP-binding cassette, subfamily B, bacterial HlyB/CyaB
LDSAIHYRNPRVVGLVAAASRLGVELDRQMVSILEQAELVEPAALVRCAVDGGIRARALKLRWKDLVSLAQSGTPTLLVMGNDGAALLDGVSADKSALILSNPMVTDSDAAREAIDQFRLAEMWSGLAIILRPRAGQRLEDAPLTLGTLVQEVLIEGRLFRDIAIGSVTLAFLAIAPPLFVMVVVDRVLAYQSYATLTLLFLGIVVISLHETLLGHAQRSLIAVAGARIDARMSLMVMARLLRLPQNFFERYRTGEIIGSAMAVNRVRDFLTGPLFRALLDLVTIIILLPVLFWINATLTWFVIGCAIVIGLIVAAFMPALARATSRLVRAEVDRGSTLYETVAGMRTVKVLALEPKQAEEYNQFTADATEARLDLANLSNWPQTLTTPINTMMTLGLLAVGCLMVLQGDTGTAGTLFAFFMLSGRVAAPLISIASLTRDWEQAKSAIGESGLVMNTRPERPAGQIGLRPRFEGNLIFADVTFQYPGALSPALEKVSFEVPAGTFLGLVGRSGSGKSTITRLIQGISTGYSGMVKLDGAELREIDLRHLRRNLGVVLQDNFLFRGSVRDNIAAGRPGMTIEKIIHACRMAGAEEFIERLPRGYDTFIEEGSPNLSGGQRQRLAIARALVVDPAILVLDEATSALDPESEALVNANLLRIARGRTMLVVSHRLSALIDADAILVLDQGRVLDVGPHADLLRRCDVYRRLWLQQNREAMKKDALHG